jgi:phage tail sheath gpL-like
MASNAVGTERVSAVVGYKITKGNFSESTPNLPQAIEVFAEANTANQAGIDFATDRYEMTTLQKIGDKYGYGSPIYLICRILRPNGGVGVGGIPVFINPQEEAVGATAKIVEIAATGTATGAGTHYVKIAGRDTLDGQSYAITISEGDTTDDIAGKIEDAVAGVLGSPVTASADSYVCELTSKWKGLTANGIQVEVDTDGNDLGISYSISVTQAGAGVPAVTAGLAKIGDNWMTIGINSYGLNSSICNEFQTWNGVPDPTNPTGRYAGIVMKPMVVLSGSVADEDTTFTDARLNEVTIAVCPAPLSKGLAMEAAANMAVLQARIAQDSPNLDCGDQFYSDMPTPLSIGTMAEYNNRDIYVKKGNSTVQLSGGKYKVCDFVTTYHPVGELPPQFRYVRNLMLDFNIRFGYYLLEQINVVGHSISNDDDVVAADKVVKPKMWKGVLAKYFLSLVSRALIVDEAFSIDSCTVTISTVNPDRFETFFRYKRTGVVRIASTTAEAGFNFGSI